METFNFSFELRALLGRTTISAFEANSLQVGDVILLEQQSNNSITLSVGQKDLFQGTLGLEGIHKAVKIGDSHV